jgi:hypothetical protein
MANFIPLLAMLFAGAGFVFFTGSSMVGDGPRFAINWSSAARLLCHSPQQAAFAAAGLEVLWIVVTLGSALHG